MSTPIIRERGASNEYPTRIFYEEFTLVLLNADMSGFANSVDPDQLASEETNWSGSALFAIKYVNIYQQSGSSNLVGW